FAFTPHSKAITLTGRAGSPPFNPALIYGLPGQTPETWRASLEQAAASPATSLFLYPLYVRPLTGLEKRADQLPCPTPRQMGDMYDLALDLLSQAGFRQL